MDAVRPSARHKLGRSYLATLPRRATVDDWRWDQVKESRHPLQSMARWLNYMLQPEADKLRHIFKDTRSMLDAISSIDIHALDTLTKAVTKLNAWVCKQFVDITVQFNGRRIYFKVRLATRLKMIMQAV